MKIRLINEQDWQKIYDFDKSIVRVGSQMNCDVQIKGKDIKPLVLQIVRSGEHDPRFVMRTFDDNVSLSRGDQVFACQAVTPQLLMDGDTVSFNTFRMIINLEDEHTRTRTSPHIEAEMFLQKRELQPDMPINGALKLKNLGTEKACQFRMNISGIPNECLKSSPLPYLYPGGEGTVGFMITHLQTRPDPGFHTVSISVSAPEEYFGETLEFNQDIYVMPVFENEIILDDDSDIMNGEDKPAPEPAAVIEEKVPEAPKMVSEPVRMDLNQRAYETEETPIDRSSAVVYKKDPQKEAFADEEDEPEQRRAVRKKKEKVVVIHRDDQKDQNIFDEEPDDDSTAGAYAESAEPGSKPREDAKPSSGTGTDAKPEKATPAETKKPESEKITKAGETEQKRSAPVKKKKTAKRKENPSAVSPERTEKPAPKEPAPAVTDAVKETVPEKAVNDPVQTIREQQPEGTEAVVAGSADVSPESVLSGTSGPAEPSSDSAEAAVKDAVPVKSKPAVKTVKKGTFDFDDAAEEKPAEAKPAEKAEKEDLFELGSAETAEPAEAKPAEKAEKKELFELGSAETTEPAEAEPAEKAEKKELFELGPAETAEPAEAEPAEKAEKKELFELGTTETAESAEAEPAEKAEKKELFEFGSPEAEKPSEPEPAPMPEPAAAQEMSAAPEAAEAPRNDEPEPVPAPEMSEEPEQAAAEPEKPAVIAANIPVIRSAGSMDFDDGDIQAPAPEPEKKAKVVVMKGGKFDE